VGTTIPISEPRDFYDRNDKPNESICLRCFLTVRGSRWESLEAAKREHKTACAFRDCQPRAQVKPTSSLFRN
jgi:hypothetical protein